ncbi:hypothetical protein C8F01DRAFT_562559 [Mycena amicta]|nr:hypothetical protein C8F01DRAFT_562559 [Mycena amicta]
MSFVTLHGLSSTTFKSPPLDGSLLFPDVLEYQAQHSPDHPLFVYPAQSQALGELDRPTALEKLTWSKAIKVFRRVGHLARASVEGDRTVVAILALTDQITYLSVVSGLMLAGYIPFPLSPRNSDAAIFHLLQSSGCNHLMVSSDPAMQTLAAAVRARFPDLQTLKLPSYREIFEPSEGILDTCFQVGKASLEETAVYMHSSGSTAFPKAIPLSFQVMFEAGLTLYYGEVDLCGEVMSAHGVPVFHMLGLVQLPYATFTGMILSSFSPAVPPGPPNPDRIFHGAVQTNATIVICPPSFLEHWAQDPLRVAHMKNFVSVIFGGGSLKPSIGDMLVSEGIHVSHLYGMTEGNCLSQLIPKDISKEHWDYFPISPHTDPALIPLEDNAEVFQVYFKKCATHTPSILDAMIDGVPALNTKDLIVKHPKKPNLWKIFGRYDDQIVHSNGEKTNPVPLEKILCDDSAVRDAIMFGQGRFHAGVIIFPNEAIDPGEEDRVVEFRRRIWPTVEKANQVAPTHSRIFKEMILVASATKPIELTAKGTPRRQAVLNSYADEIRDLYLGVEDSFQKHLPAPPTFDAASSLMFVRKVVGEVMKVLPGDEDDLFAHGCDSLQATWIRNSIVHAAVNSKELNYKDIPHNFVYSHPTVDKLASMLSNLASGTGWHSADMDRTNPFAQAIVEICSGSGTPLFILSGVSGDGSHFVALRAHFKGSLWALQITDDVPLTSLADLVQYWHNLVRAKQPHGPYRFATYSAAALSGVMLTKLMEDAGEDVVQLTFLDNCPTMWLREENEVWLREKTIEEYLYAASEAIVELHSQDPTIPEEKTQFFRTAFFDEPPVDFRRSMRVGHTVATLIIEFLCGFYPYPETKSHESFVGPFTDWVHSVQAPMTVVVAELGTIRANPGGSWQDLGASRLGKGAKMEFIEGVGHFGLVSSERVARILESSPSG